MPKSTSATMRAPTAGELGGAPEPTPLWFYILKESEVRTSGVHLGVGLQPHGCA